MVDQNKQLLQIESVVKDFGGLRAINNVSLEVTEGEIQGLIGPNGSGKTTLINLIDGIYRIDKGRFFSIQIESMACNPM